MSAPRGVPRETDAAELGIYFRLLEWAVWSKDRMHIPARRDDVAGDFELTPRIRERLAAARSGHFPPSVQAIDKAVASMKLEHDLHMLEYLLKQYFLEWKTVETIAIDEDLSEFHVVEYLQRAMRRVAERLPHFERAVSAEERR